MATVADGTHPTGMHSCLSYKNCQSEFVSIRLRVVWLNSWKHQRLLSMSYGRKALQGKETLQIWLENSQWAFLQKPAALSCGSFCMSNLAKKYCIQQPKLCTIILLENRNRTWEKVLNSKCFRCPRKNIKISTCVRLCVSIKLIFNLFLPAAAKLWPRLCFYSCMWFCSQGGSASVHAGIPPPPPGGGTPPGKEAPPGIRSMSGRYASYWNAFLFLL